MSPRGCLGVSTSCAAGDGARNRRPRPISDSAAGSGAATRWEPAFDFVRNDPRFIAIINKVFG